MHYSDVAGVVLSFFEQPGVMFSSPSPYTLSGLLREFQGAALKSNQLSKAKDKEQKR